MASYQKGSTGPQVKNIQHYCNLYGFTDNAGHKLVEDGVFGDLTTQAVKKFQTAAKIVVDGIWGPQTEGAAQKWESTHKPITIAAATTTQPTVQAAAVSDYVRIPPFTEYYQQTDYTCGPCSLRMILSSYPVNVSEQQLATWAGSKPIVGTTPNQLSAAVKNEVDVAFKRNFVLNWISFAGTPLAQIAALIKQGKRFMCNIKTGDSTGWRFPGYKDIWGHYIMLVGVDPDKQTVTFADPDRGIVTVSYADALHATSLISSPSLGEFYEQ